MINRDDDAPGRKVMKRENGARAAYWVARPDAVKAGYAPKTVRLTDDPGGETAPEAVAARCRVMWAEMLAFLDGEKTPGFKYDVGTIGWVSERYLRDETSPYREVRPVTAAGYDYLIKMVCKAVGDRHIAKVSQADLKRWFWKWGERDEAGLMHKLPQAYRCIQALRLVVNYGVTLKDAGCVELSAVLSKMRFKSPKRRTSKFTVEHAAAFIPKAHEMGWPSMARAVAIQISCALRQKDVIGEHVTRPGVRGKEWANGLLWGEHVAIDLSALAKPTSKSNFEEVAEHDLRLLPLVVAELERTPLTNRIGPVVINERTKKPYDDSAFRKRFRKIARAAGVPDEIQNRDSRAGAISEAYDAGADLPDAMALGTHTQVKTSMVYKRGQMAANGRIARLRFGAGTGREQVE